jgi:hypothetical protein
VPPTTKLRGGAGMSGICGKPKLGFRFRAMLRPKSRMSPPGISRHTGRGKGGIHSFGRTSPLQPIATTGDFIAKDDIALHVFMPGGDSEGALLGRRGKVSPQDADRKGVPFVRPSPSQGFVSRPPVRAALW